MNLQRSKLSPSRAAVDARTKARESMALLRDYWGLARAPQDFGWLFDDVDAYERLLARFAHRSLRESSVLEIGFGQRPYRLQALLGMGVDAEGIDAEVPILDGSLREYRAALAVNGVERVAKSLVRHVLFDRAERAALASRLATRGIAPCTDQARFVIADATTWQPGRRYDLILSEDVFEHIDADGLPRLVAALAGWLNPGGLALIRPNIFTGITGGHLVEWNRRSFETRAPRRSEPWDHLRARRHRPNTSLNELRRSQYRELFSRHFVILAEEVSLPDLGREFLTGAVAEDLAAWTDEELFSNQVRFALRPRERR